MVLTFLPLILSQSVMEGGCCWSVDDDIFYALFLNHRYSCVPVLVCCPIAAPDMLILSLVTESLTVLVSVTGFFFTTISSLTNGFLVTSTSSLFFSATGSFVIV